jgi:ectoine hydroxylase-related dioxygenase (phytanoyl-CoA dioxygenase family)
MKLNTDHKKKFEQNGFLIIDVFSSNELKEFEKSLFYIIEKQVLKANKNEAKIKIDKNNFISSVLSQLDKFNHDHIADISDFLMNTTESLQLLSNKKIKQTINFLLNNDKNDPLYITNGGPLVAMPNDVDYTYKFHKDTFYTIPESNYIQIWAPLIENASIKNGALQICKKSHKNKWRGQYIKKNVPNRHKYRVRENEVKKYDIINCKLKLGQVLFFDSGIAHQSGRNSSKKARISLVGVYHNIKSKNIRPMLPQYKFKGKSPEDYFKELNSN